jgi:hypothetical protein
VDFATVPQYISRTGAAVLPDFKKSGHATATFVYLLIAKNMVLLVTSDNEQFHADKEVVERSVLIKNMLEGELLVSFTLPQGSLRKCQMLVKPTNQSLCPTFHRVY